MRDWRFWKKAQVVERGSQPADDIIAPEEGVDEWSFLRSQPDHDADEMAQVHGPAASSESYAEDETSGADLAAPFAAPSASAPDLSELPPAPVSEAALTTEDRVIGGLLREALGIIPSSAGGNGPDPTTDPLWD